MPSLFFEKYFWLSDTQREHSNECRCLCDIRRLLVNRHILKQNYFKTDTGVPKQSQTQTILFEINQVFSFKKKILILLAPVSKKKNEECWQFHGYFTIFAWISKRLNKTAVAMLIFVFFFLLLSFQVSTNVLCSCVHGKWFQNSDVWIPIP